MSGKKTVLWLCKCVIAGCIAFGMLTLVCNFYYKRGVHITSQTFSTDYYWVPNSYYSKMDEGFSRGYVDGNGFNNTYPNKTGGINVLLMGSSHLEGFNVAQNKNITYVLNELFAQNGQDWYAYNIGMSGHYFNRVAANMKRGINEFAPSDFVVIETAILDFTPRSLQLAIEDRLPKMESFDQGIFALLQRNSYLKLIYSQYTNIRGGGDDAPPPASTRDGQQEQQEYAAAVNTLLAQMSETAGQAGCKIIVLYHPHIELQPDGSGILTRDKYTDAFKSACAGNGIIFLDTGDACLKEYEQSKILPHGFVNAEIAKGHLNEDGHRIVAGELYRVIAENS